MQLTSLHGSMQYGAGSGTWTVIIGLAHYAAYEIKAITPPTGHT